MLQYIPLASSAAPAATSRLMTLIEYHGESDGGGPAGVPCGATHGAPMYCDPQSNFTQPPFYFGGPLCVCQDSTNNTYSCLRGYAPSSVPAGPASSSNFRYCEFADSVGTVEYFDYTSDPFELSNLGPSMDVTLKATLHSRLAAAVACSGSAYCNAALGGPL